VTIAGVIALVSMPVRPLPLEVSRWSPQSALANCGEGIHKALGKPGAGEEGRTPDLLITNFPLYEVKQTDL